MEKHYLTKSSHTKLVKELDQRQYVLRKEISERIRESAKDGDLSENAAYKEVRDEESFNEARIEQLKIILRDATMVDNAHLKNIVEIGDTLELTDERGRKLVFQLVDSQEADPPEKISAESPLGAALLGKHGGEKIKVKMPGGATKEYKIVKVS